MSQAFTLGLLQSFMTVDHSVPITAQVFEQKYCENCSRSFARPRPGAFRVIHIDGQKSGHNAKEFGPGTVLKDTGQRYCPACRRNALSPIDDQVYRDQLPREAEMKHAHHLPKYDESIVRFRQPIKSKAIAPSRRRVNHGNWLNRLLMANEKAPLSCDDMLRITGMKASANVFTSLHHFGFQLVVAGHVWPRKQGVAGQPPRIYNIEVLVH